MLMHNKQTISSLEIAELTGKQHAHLMRDIREMEEAWINVNQSKFGLIYYIDQRNRQQPQYQLTKTECLYIATKFNDEARARLILRWEHLENTKTIDFSDPNSVLRLAQNWVDEQNKRLAAEKQIKVLEAKTELMDLVLDSDRNIDIGQAAKILELGFGRNTLFRMLKEKGIFFKTRNEPMQAYVDKGYFLLKETFITKKDGDVFVFIKVLVTQKGLEFLAKLFSAIPKQKKLAMLN